MSKESDEEATGDPQSNRVARVEFQILDSLAEVVFELNSGGVVRSVTGDLDGVLGYEPREVVGRPMTSLVPPGRPDVPDEFVSTGTMLEVLHEGTHLTHLDVPLESASGHAVETTVSVVRTDADDLLCLVEDVRETGRRSWGDRTAERLLEGIGEPVYTLRDDGTVTWVNDATVSFTGYDRAELVGETLFDLVSTDESEDGVRRLSELLAGEREGVETVEVDLIKSSGELARVETTLGAVPGPRPGPRFVGTVHDLTRVKRRERRLELLKQVFSRLFRHNVRNKLNVIQGQVRSLDTRGGDSSDHTETVLAAAQELLDHGEKSRKLTSIVEHTDFREVDIAAVVDEAVSTVRADFPAATVDVHPPESETIRTHPDVAVAVEELLRNGLEHASVDDPWAQVWVDTTDDYLTLFVEDLAGGVPRREVEILNRGVETQLTHGSGVGLWLVYTIVESCNAKMIVHQTEEGSVIGIKFPRHHPGREHETTKTVEYRQMIVPSRVHPEANTLGHAHDETVVPRRDELHQLQLHYDTVERGGSHTVFVTGEAGVGKATLVEQFERRLRESDSQPRIVEGRCDPESAPPYAVFREVMAALDTTTELTESFDRHAGVTTERSDTISYYKQALFETVAEELRARSRDRPLVVVLRGLQWANRGTVELLEYLIDEVGQSSHSILFFGTYRTGGTERETRTERETGTESVTEDRLVTLTERTVERDRGTVLELGPFDEADVRDLLAYSFPAGPTPDVLAERIHELTDGQPLFVAELVRYLDQQVESTRPSEESLRLLRSETVASLDGVVRERIAALPEPARSVLEVGAVIGNTVSEDVLVAATDRSEHRLEDLVETLTSERFWDRTGETFTFVHQQVREIVLGELSESRRARLHERVAGAVETVHDGGLDDFHGTLANHYERAGEYERAVDHHRRAGGRALEAYAHEEATTAYERALSLAREHDCVGGETTVAVRADLAEAYRRVGEYTDAYGQIRAGLTETAERREVCRLLGVRAEIEADEGRFGLARVTSRRQLEHASDSELRDVRTEALCRLGAFARRRGELGRASEHLQNGLEAARATDDWAAVGTIYKELGSVALRQSAYERADSWYERGLDLARERSLVPLEAACLTNRGAVAHRRGDLDDARDHWEESIEKKRRVGDVRGIATSLNNLGRLADQQGEYERAVDRLTESLEIRRRIDDRPGIAYTLNTLGILTRKRGECERALEYVEESLEIARDTDDTLCEAWCLENRGYVFLSWEEFERARDDFERGLQRARQLGNTETEIGCLCGLAALARRRGDLGRAETLLDGADDVRDEDGDPLQHGRVQLEYARLAVRRGDCSAARDRVERAVERFESIGATHWVARCRVVRGRIAAESGALSLARDHWQSALETFQTLGATEDGLTTLRHLVEETPTRNGESEIFRWVGDACDLLGDAPDRLAERHRTWFDDEIADL